MSFTPKSEVDQLFGRANPNPNRVGCPSRDVLLELARNTRPLNDPGYAHLRNCSPCYLEVRAIQESEKRVRREKRVRVLVPLAAAVVAAIGLVGWWVTSARTTRSDVVQAITLDLRTYAPLRGDAQPERPPVVLPRAPVQLRLLLPPGSEEGDGYEVRIVDGSRTLATGAGSVALIDKVAAFQSPIDLASVPRGAYELRVGRPPDQWLTAPVRIE